MRRLSLLVLTAGALIAALIFLIWPKAAPEAQAEAEAPPVAAEPPAPAAQPQPAAVPPPQTATTRADTPAAAAAPANAPGALAGRQMDGIRELVGRMAPHDLSLYVRFQRMGVAPPPETKTLIERRKAGATVAELEAYVREAFPKDARAHMVAIQWIRSGPPAPPPRR